eukprot:10052779-Prorocentrum_lima.AAC.1
MPAARHPAQVLDHNVRGRGKLGKRVGSLHATKEPETYLQRCLGRFEHGSSPFPVGVHVLRPSLQPEAPLCQA